MDLKIGDRRLLAPRPAGLEIGRHARDDVDLDAQRGEGFRQFVSVVPHPALPRRKFASDKAKFHYSFSPDFITCQYTPTFARRISRLCPANPLTHSTIN